MSAQLVTWQNQPQVIDLVTDAHQRKAAERKTPLERAYFDLALAEVSHKHTLSAFCLKCRFLCCYVSYVFH